MNIIDLETPLNTEKHFAPKTDDEYPFYITEYGKTFKNTNSLEIFTEIYAKCQKLKDPVKYKTKPLSFS